MSTLLRRQAATTSAALLCAALLAACTTSEASPPPKTTPQQPPSTTATRQPTSTTRAAPTPELVELKLDRGRQSPGVIAAGGRDAPYNYGPSVMVDSGRYRMWWCSQLGIARPARRRHPAGRVALDGRPFAGPGGRRADRRSCPARPGGFDACTPATRR